MRTLVAAIASMVVLLGALLALAADGLPKALPDLYDPAEIAHLTLLQTGPYRCPEHGGHAVDGLMATVLASPMLASGPHEPGGYNVEMLTHGQRHTSVQRVIGFARETRQGRIIAVVESFYYGVSEARSLRVWVDLGWVATGRGSGDWESLTDGRLLGPFTAQQARTFLQPFLKQVHAGAVKAGLSAEVQR